MSVPITLRTTAVACCALFLLVTPKPGVAQTAAEIANVVDKTGARGGWAVWIAGDEAVGDWADGLAKLHRDHRFLVLGLHQDAVSAAAARVELAKRGVIGGVTVDTFVASALPMIDESVNLLVVAKSAPPVQSSEIMRVLAPLSAAVAPRDARGLPQPAASIGDGWSAFTKPWPKELDDWTHYMHDASNNAVSHDTRIGPPRHLQWQCGPRWSRHHDHMASMSAMVSAGGRMFYVLDEGSHVSPQLPSDWQLVARDAFNGAQLWKRPIPNWHTHLWPLKSGPANLPRRLVAVDDVVYVTLGESAPVTAIRAKDGKTIRVYPGTDGTEEILLHDGVLLALVNRTPINYEADLAEDSEKGKSRDSRTTHSPRMSRIWAGIRSKRWTHGDRVIRAFDADTGKALWEKAGTVLPLTLGVGDDGVFFHDAEKIVALDLASGKQRWVSKPVPVWQGLDGRGLQSWFAPTLVVHGDKVLFAGGEKTHMSYQGWGSKDIGQDTMSVLSTKDGKKVWTAPSPFSGYNSPEDLFVANGKVWMGSTAKGGGGGRYVGHDLATGKEAAAYPPTVKAFWFHHRCYRAKATEKYILSSRTGIEFVDLKTGEWTINHWVRGGCLYGIMPANGMVYSPPNPCACYPESKLYGFTALAPARKAVTAANKKSAERLQRGSAFGALADLKPATSKPPSTDWPTYRHDPARSGSARAGIAAKLRPAWELKLGGRLTQPVSANGLLFVADTDRQTIHAINTETGAKAWSYTAGGRIDSAPTCGRGRVLFGAADGYLYCLRATDGALAWRFRAAPHDQRMIAFEQIESVWPIHGSVLVQGDVATVVAGRSMFVDGGLRLCRINIDTGALLGEKVLDHHNLAGDGRLQDHVKGLNMPVALPDILSSDGEHLYMRSQTMDLEGNRLKLGPGKSGPDHLFAPYGFTDSSWFHRTYWVFGDAFSGGVGGFSNGQRKPAGRILVNNDTTVFGYARKPQYYRWGSVIDYHLYATARPGAASGPSAGTGKTNPTAPKATASAPQGILFANKPSLNPTGTALTVAARVKTDATDGTILVRGANSHGFALILTDRKPRMLLRTKGKTYEAVSRKQIGADWTHVAGVLHDDGRMQVFLDGELVGAATGVPKLGGEPSIPMKIGHDDTNQLLPKPLTPFIGALDEVMLFHRAWSPDALKRQAVAGAKLTKADRAALVLHLSFTDGQVQDNSGRGNHGTFSGGKIATTDSPTGAALVLKQSKKNRAAKPAQRKRRTKLAYRWTQDIPMMVRAMALAGDVLFVAGPEDVLDETAAFQKFSAADSQKSIAAQHAALQGKTGALLHAVDADTGKTLAKYKLPTPPVFDGMSIAAGHVFIATIDGRVLAFKAK